ncbi:TonB-linked outer membrane protein, SusC/RagA family [bacterium A37T11]|nr:TonB-linked outer membrane protein, SusC/RagA family [bacterium A37T11]
MYKKYFAWLCGKPYYCPINYVLTMKITIILLTASFLQVSAHSFAQRVTINVKKAPVKDVLYQLTKQTGYNFIADADLLARLRPITLKLTDESLQTTLETCFDTDKFEFLYGGNETVVIKERRNKNYINLQQKSVIGNVKDEDGNPIAGATVKLKNGDGSTITDQNGNYKLNLGQQANVLQFSNIGYISLEISVASQPVINVVLKQSINEMDEVVVVGYGTQKRSDLTGAIGSVSAEKINQVPATTAAQALQGRVGGVLVSQSSYKPGSSPSVLIRGKRSISASSDPLYVVDGIPITGGMDQVSPNDIASMDVLKDASATAIYGARGSNGVIMITTKKGVDGKTQVDYNAYYGPQTILRQLNYMDGAEFAETVREAYRATGKYKSTVPNWVEDQTIPTFRNDPYTLESIHMGYDENGNYDPSRVRNDSKWWEAVERTGMLTDHQLSIRGGNKETKFLFGGSYNKNDGVYKDEDYERYTIRMNLDHQLNKAIKLGGQTMFSHSLQDRGSGMQGNWRVIPVGRYYDDNGKLLLRVSGTDDQYWNPLTRLVDGAESIPLKTNHFFGSYYGEAKLPVEGLRFRSNFGLDMNALQDYEFRSSDARNGQPNYAKNATENRFMYTWENLLFYDKEMGDHTLGVTLLQSIQQNLVESNGIPVEDIPSDQLLYYNVGSGLTPGAIVSNKQQWNIASFMGRINYNYKSKYLLTVSARYDGASRLADSHKWVLFPAAAFAWRLKEENFLKNVNLFNDLKLRVGFGTTASSEVSPYQTKGTLISKYYNFGDEQAIGYAPDILPNPNLSWETTGQWNAGVDFAILNNRISGSIDFYVQNTSDLLIDRQLPVVSGFSTVKSNVGKTRNKGIELSLNTINVKGKNFQWTTDWMFYTNKEEIVELYNGKEDDPGNKWFIGNPINVSFDYKKVGIWQNTPQELDEMAKFNANGSNFKPGSIRLYDNGDYTISSEDRVIQGQARPKYIGSLVNNFRYKQLDLNVFLYGSFGSMLENNIEYLNQAHRNSGVKLNYWTPENPTNDFPRPIEGIDNVDYRNTLYYEKADFVRIRTLSLGYTLPKINATTIKQLRIYVTAQNPFLWTGYSGVDPEGSVGWAAPSVRSWLLGVNLSF